VIPSPKSFITLQSGFAEPGQKDTANTISPLIINGDFEWGPSVSGFTTINAGSTALPYWKVESGSIDFDGTSWKDASGNHSLDMAGHADGSISQSFATELDAEYQVTFYLAGNPGGDEDKKLKVSAAGESKTFEFSVKDRTNDDMGWEKKTFDFIAESSNTTLTFTSIEGEAWGAALDQVSVVQTSESTNYAKIVNIDPAWGEIPGANPISVASDTDVLPGNISFRTTFELPEIYSAPTIDVQLHADDYVTVYLNGYEIGNGDIRSIKSFTDNDSAHFESGNNTLDFVVTNAGDGPNAIWLDYNAIVNYDTIAEESTSESTDDLTDETTTEESTGE